MSAAEDTMHVMPEGNAPVGAGHLLRGARERSNLSIGEVATRLRLDARRVQAIESDQYGELPAPTFVRGYLYSYARLLRIPPGPIMEAYDRQGFGPPPLVADIAQSSQARSTDFPVRLVTWAVAILLLALVVLWWQGRQPHVDAQPEAAGVSEAAPSVAGGARPGLPASGARTPEPDAAPIEDPVETAAAIIAAASIAQPADTTPGSEAAASAPLEPPVAPSPVGAPGAAAPVAGTPPPAPAQPSGAPDPSPLTSARVRVPSLTNAPTVSITEPPRLAREGEDRLSVSLEHDSWVEVYDNEDARLFYDLARAGSAINVSGQAPFKVLLGYARNARVLVNGRPFDYTPFVKREIARFDAAPAPPASAPVAAPTRAAEPAPAEPPAAEPPAEPQIGTRN